MSGTLACPPCGRSDGLSPPSRSRCPSAVHSLAFVYAARKEKPASVEYAVRQVPRASARNQSKARTPAGLGSHSRVAQISEQASCGSGCPTRSGEQFNLVQVRVRATARRARNQPRIRVKMLIGLIPSDPHH
jgi:hypothetical protein